MRFTQDSSSGLNLIRAHRAGELEVNEVVYRVPIILSPGTVSPAALTEKAGELGAADAQPLLALDPEVVLLGTGARQIVPARLFSAQFLGKGIGLEVMNTGAACRTFNVLAAEHRRVVALIWP